MGNGALDAAVCERVAKTATASLPGEGGPPSELAVLPGTDRVAKTVEYTRKGYLGVGELGQCLHADYAPKGGATYTLFAMLPEPGEANAKIWQRLVAASWRPVTVDDLEVLQKAVPYRDPVLVAKTARGIIGITDAGGIDRALAVLRRAVNVE